MKLPALITTDLHLTDHPSTAYRFGLFKWINEQIDERGLESVLILGDITDAKDNHPASLVNKITDAICSINADVFMLAGNHDWLLKGQEFFRFLNVIPGINFITAPKEGPDIKVPCMYLPYSKNPAKEWAGFDFSHYEFLFMHQTIKGAIASNGQAMEGEELPALNAGKVYSGDIHVPQTLNGVTYIGSPYHVHFGDNFTPRVLMLDRQGKEHWLHYPAPKRVVVKASSLEELRGVELDLDDQVKLRMCLDDSDKHAWLRIKREAVAHLEGMGVLVHGVELEVKKSTTRVRVGQRPALTQLTPAELITKFVEAEDLDGMTFDAAMDVIES